MSSPGKRKSLSNFHGKLKARAAEKKLGVTPTPSKRDEGAREEDINAEQYEQLKRLNEEQRVEIDELKEKNIVLQNEVKELKIGYERVSELNESYLDENMHLKVNIEKIKSQLETMNLTTKEQDEALLKAQLRAKALEKDLQNFMALENDIIIESELQDDEDGSVVASHRSDLGKNSSVKEKIKDYEHNVIQQNQKNKGTVIYGALRGGIDSESAGDSSDSSDEEETEEERKARKELEQSMFGGVDDDDNGATATGNKRRKSILHGIRMTIDHGKASSALLKTMMRKKDKLLDQRATEAAFLKWKGGVNAFKISQLTKNMTGTLENTEASLRLALENGDSLRKRATMSVLKSFFSKWSDRLIHFYFFKWKTIDMKLKLRDEKQSIVMEKNRAIQDINESNNKRFALETRNLRTKLIMKSIYLKFSKNKFGYAFNKWSMVTNKMKVQSIYKGVHGRNKERDIVTLRLLMRSRLQKLTNDHCGAAFSTWKLMVNRATMEELKQNSERNNLQSRNLATKLVMKSIFMKITKSTCGSAFHKWHANIVKIKSKEEALSMLLSSSQNHRSDTAKLLMKSVFSKLTKNAYASAFHIWRKKIHDIQVRALKEQCRNSLNNARSSSEKTFLTSIILRIQRRSRNGAFQKWKSTTQKIKLREAKWKLEERMEKFNEIDRQNSKYKGDIKSVRDDANRFSSEIRALKTEIELLSKQLEHSENMKNALENRVEIEYIDELENKKVEIRQLRREIESVKNDRNMLRLQLNEMDKLRNKLKATEKTVMNNKNKFLELNTDLEQSNRTKTVLENHLKSLIGSGDGKVKKGEGAGTTSPGRSAFKEKVLHLNQYQQTDDTEIHGKDLKGAWKNHMLHLQTEMSKKTWFGKEKSPSKKKVLSGIEDAFEVQYQAHEAKIKEDHERNRLQMENDRMRNGQELEHLKKQEEKKIAIEMLKAKAAFQHDIDRLKVEKEKLETQLNHQNDQLSRQTIKLDASLQEQHQELEKEKKTIAVATEKCCKDAAQNLEDHAKLEFQRVDLEAKLANLDIEMQKREHVLKADLEEAVYIINSYVPNWNERQDDVQDAVPYVKNAMRYIFETENQLRYELHNQSGKVIRFAIERQECIKQMNDQHKTALAAAEEKHLSAVADIERINNIKEAAFIEKEKKHKLILLRKHFMSMMLVVCKRSFSTWKEYRNSCLRKEKMCRLTIRRFLRARLTIPFAKWNQVVSQTKLKEHIGKLNDGRRTLAIEQKFQRACRNHVKRSFYQWARHHRKIIHLKHRFVNILMSKRSRMLWKGWAELVVHCNTHKVQSNHAEAVTKHAAAKVDSYVRLAMLKRLFSRKRKHFNVFKKYHKFCKKRGMALHSICRKIKQLILRKSLSKWHKNGEVEAERQKMTTVQVLMDKQRKDIAVEKQHAALRFYLKKLTHSSLAAGFYSLKRSCLLRQQQLKLIRRLVENAYRQRLKNSFFAFKFNLAQYYHSRNHDTFKESVTNHAAEKHEMRTYSIARYIDRSKKESKNILMATVLRAWAKASSGRSGKRKFITRLFARKKFAWRRTGMEQWKRKSFELNVQEKQSGALRQNRRSHLKRIIRLFVVNHCHRAIQKWKYYLHIKDAKIKHGARLVRVIKQHYLRMGMNQLIITLHSSRIVKQYDEKTARIKTDYEMEAKKNKLSLEKERELLMQKDSQKVKAACATVKRELEDLHSEAISDKEKDHQKQIKRMEKEKSDLKEEMSHQMESAMVKVKQSISREKENSKHKFETFKMEERSKLRQEIEAEKAENEKKLFKMSQEQAKRFNIELENAHKKHQENLKKAIVHAKDDAISAEKKKHQLELQKIYEKHKSDLDVQHHNYNRLRDELEEKRRILKLDYESKTDKLIAKHHDFVQELKDSYEIKISTDVNRAKASAKQELSGMYEIESRKIKREADEFANKKISDARAALEKGFKESKLQWKLEMESGYQTKQNETLSQKQQELKDLESKLKKVVDDHKGAHLLEVTKLQSVLQSAKEEHKRDIVFHQSEFSKEKLRLEAEHSMTQKEIQNSFELQLQRKEERMKREAEKNIDSSRKEANMTQERLRKAHEDELKRIHEAHTRLILDHSNEKESRFVQHSQEIKKLNDEWQMKFESKISSISQDIESRSERHLNKELSEQSRRMQSVIDTLESNIERLKRNHEMDKLDIKSAINLEWNDKMKQKLEERERGITEKLKTKFEIEMTRISALHTDTVNRNQSERNEAMEKLHAAHGENEGKWQLLIKEEREKLEKIETEFSSSVIKHEETIKQCRDRCVEIENEMQTKLKAAYEDSQHLRKSEIEALRASYREEKSHLKETIDALKLQHLEEVQRVKEDIHKSMLNEKEDELSHSRSVADLKMTEQLQQSKLHIEDLSHRHKVEVDNMRVQLEATHASERRMQELEHKNMFKAAEQSQKSRIEEIISKHELAMKELASSHVTQSQIDAKRQRVVLEEEKIKAAADTRNRMTVAMTQALEKQKQDLDSRHMAIVQDLKHRHEQISQQLMLDNKNDAQKVLDHTISTLRREMDEQHNHKLKMVKDEYETKIQNLQDSHHKQSLKNMEDLEKKENIHAEALRNTRSEVEAIVKRQESDLRKLDCENTRKECNDIMNSSIKMIKENHHNEMGRVKKEHESILDSMKRKHEISLETRINDTKHAAQVEYTQRIEIINKDHQASLARELNIVQTAFDKALGEANQEIKMLEEIQEQKLILDKNYERLQDNFNEKSNEVLQLKAKIKILEDTMDELTNKMRLEIENHKEEVAKMLVQRDKALEEAGIDHANHVKRQQTEHEIATAAAIEETRSKVKQEDEGIRVEKENLLTEKLKMAFQDDMNAMKVRYENLLQSSQNAVDEANDQRKNNTQYFENVISKMSLERNDMKLHCDKEIIRARHSIEAHEDKCKRALTDVTNTLKEVTKDRDETLGKLRAVEEVAQMRESERLRLDSLLKETVSQMEQEHKAIIGAQKAIHAEAISTMTDEHAKTREILQSEKTLHEETKEDFAVQTTALKEKHANELESSTRLAAKKMMYVRALPLHRRFSMINFTKHAPEPPPPPPHPTYGMSSYERTAYLIEHSESIQRFMRAHAHYKSGTMDMSINKSSKWTEWRLRRRQSMFASAVREDKFNMLLWAVFHYYASMGSPTHASAMGITTFKRFVKDIAVQFNSYAVDLIFTKRCGMPTSDGSGGHDKRLEYDEFVLALCDISNTVYSHYEDDIHELFRINIVPRVEKLGRQVDDSVLHQDIHSILKTALSYSKIDHLLTYNRKMFLHLSKFYSNISSASRVNDSKRTFARIRFDGILLLARDFKVVPRIATNGELQHAFHHCATSETSVSVGGLSVAHENVVKLFLSVAISSHVVEHKRQNHPFTKSSRLMRKQNKQLASSPVSTKDPVNWDEATLSGKFEALIQCMNSGEGFKKIIRRGGTMPVAKFWYEGRGTSPGKLKQTSPRKAKSSWIK